MEKKLFLLDAYALIYRAYYAFIRRPITNGKGQDTSAIFGFTKTLVEILKKEQPTHLAIAFDPVGGKTFRHEKFPAYKANRQETPEVIKESVPIIKEIVSALNIPILIYDNYEADDVIGTIAHKAEKDGFTVYMMTPDKDYGQLVTPNIFMYKPKHSGNDVEVLGVKEICEHYGISEPKQVIDILAIWGDASDNVPGVPGVGEKGATKLVGEFGSVENILDNLDKLKGKQKESFENNREQLLLSKELVTIDLNVPIEVDEENYRICPPNEEKLRELFTELNFSSFLRDFQLAPNSPTGNGSTKAPAPTLHQQGSLFDMFDNPQVSTKRGKTINDIPHTYHIAQTQEEINQLVALLEKQPDFCFDTETTGTNPLENRIVGLSFAIKAHEAWYVPVPQNEQEAAELMENFRSVFENEKISKTGQNLKFDILVLKNFGIEVKGKLFDTMIMHYILDPESRHNMTVLSENLLDYSPIEIEELIGSKGKNQGSMANVELSKIAEYAAEDADVTWQLREVLEKKLHEAEMFDLYASIEAPLISVLADMEACGVRVDLNVLKDAEKDLSGKLLKLDDEIKEMAGDPTLNISSPKQLGVVLFEKLQIDNNVKRTKTKQYSTSEETLANLRDKHPIIDKILEYRSLKKLLSSYIESLPELVNKKTGKIHTSFNQAVTATGRLSSNNPNLQNIPIRDENGREIRKAFIPSSDEYTFFSADYSQIELRIMAHMSGDDNLIEAFNSQEDIHTATAAKIYHVKPEEVTREQRSKAKTANFGIIYGISTFGLAQRLQIPRAEAKELIEGYFALYPGVKTYMDKVIEDARENGYVSTLFGRKRWLRDIKSNNGVVRGLAERNAINAPIQGSAADIIKIAMIRIQDEIKKRNLKSRMILQVHDELDFDVYKPELGELKEMVEKEMQNAAKLKVKLIAESGEGKNWLEAH